MLKPVEQPKSLQKFQGFRPWRELAVLSWMLMDVSWISILYLLAAQFQPSVSYWEAVLIFAVILFGSYASTRILIDLEMSNTLRRAVLAVMVLVCLVIGIMYLNTPGDSPGLMRMLNQPVRTFRDIYNLVPAEFFVIIFVLFACWRGISKVDKLVGPADVMVAFRWGVLVLMVYALASSKARISNGSEMYLLLFAGLLGMSSARIAVIGYLRGGVRIPFDKRRIAGLLAVILLMLAMSGWIMSMSGGKGMDFIGVIVTGIVYLLAFLLSPLMFVVMQATMWIGRWVNLSKLLQSLVNITQQLEEWINRLIADLQQLSHNPQNMFFEQLYRILDWSRPLLLWAAVLFFIATLLLIVRGQSRPGKTEVEGNLSDVEVETGTLDRLRDALRRGISRITEGLEQVMRLRTTRGMFAALRIRRIYARLMDLSTRLDRPRPAAKTPVEFLPTLEALFPALKGEIHLITMAYLRVRYGDMPESDEDMDQIETAWRSVSAQGAEILREQKARR